MIRLQVFLGILFMAFVTVGSAQEELSVLKGWMAYTNNENAFYNHLRDLADGFLEKREAEVAKIQSRADWMNRQEQIKKVLMEAVGPFPEKTPLNPRITGTLERPDFIVEKVLYQSRPNFYVTAALFLPKGVREKSPAVIYCSGHTEEGFRSEVYQTVCINLVKKGFVVLAYDPFGQGERWQYYDPATGESKIGGATKEHSYAGAQCFLTGSSAARYMVWDGIRAVDYLLTREEVDPNRIGITGRSGGGTQSSYIAAFDDRILAAAPECYITSFKRLYESRGPQDAEQNFFHGIASGIDHADLLEVRAPKPTLMITTTRDFFSIQGARETAAEVRRAFAAFGKEENFAMVEDDAAHASTMKNREAMYAFFQKHLNLPGDSTDMEVEVFKKEELFVTPTGQLIGSVGGETVFTLNREEAKKKLESLEQQRKNPADFLVQVRTQAKALSGYEHSSDSEAFFAGRFIRDGYAVEKYFTRGSGKYKIPFLLFVPSQAGDKKALLYLHGEGKEKEAGPGGEIEQWVKQGYTVLAPDLLGLGEMGPGLFKGDAYTFKVGKAPYNLWFASIQAGKSLTGIRAGDISRLVNVLNRWGYSSVTAVAYELLCQDLIYASAFDSRINAITLIRPFLSYAQIVLNEYYVPRLVPSTVAGALEYYDLPDVIALIAPRKLSIMSPIDQMEKPLLLKNAEELLHFVKSRYDEANAEEMLQVSIP